MKIPCALLLAGLAALDANAEPKFHCLIVNNPVLDARTGKPKDNLYVSSEIEADDKMIWHGDLVLAHPASYTDAGLAIEEFVKKRAPEIVRKRGRK